MISSIKQTKVQFQKPTIESWDTFRKGWNTLLLETEIDGQEMVNSQNLLLTGMGIPTKRWGSTLAFEAGSSIQQQIYRGVAMSGLEFDSSAIPGALNTNFFNSAQTTYDYFGKTSGKGFNIVRLPFTWERMQPTLGGSLATQYQAYINEQIAFAASSGMNTILDLHNFGERTDYLNGGITETFTESTPNLIYPYADYSANGHIVLRDFGQSLFGTQANPVSPATGYNISWIMQFNSRDTSFGGEGLQIKPMWTDDNNTYNFDILDDGTEGWTLSANMLGVTEQLASGTFGFSWGSGVSHAFAIDVNQSDFGFINIKLDGSFLYTHNSVPVVNEGALGNLTYRSIDAMKLTKDNINSQVSQNFVTSYCQFLAQNLNITHIAISMPLDSNADFIANGNTPGPLTVEQYLAMWATAIHNAGLKVFYRGTFSNMENIYNFPYLPDGPAGFIPAGTTSSAPTDGTSTWLGKLWGRIQTLGSNFQSGDIFAPFPEQTAPIFSGNSFLSTGGSGIQANFKTFFESVPTVITNAFSNISKSGIVSNLTSQNYSELRSGYLDSTFVTTVGAMAVDYYGNYDNDGYAPTQFVADLQTIRSSHGNTTIFLEEWSDYYSSDNQTVRTAYLNQFYPTLAVLEGLGQLNGFNYWGGWENGGSFTPEGILVNSGTDDSPIWSLAWNGLILQQYLAVTTSPTLKTGQVAWLAAGVHAQIASMTLNIGGSTSGGGFETNRVGTTAVPISQLANFWGSMATYYKGYPGLLGYDLMNEPNSMPIPTHWTTSLASVVSLSAAAGVATATTSGAHGYYVGDYVNVSGASISNYNGQNLTILSTPTTTQYTYSVASGVATPSGGTRLSQSPFNYNTTATNYNMIQAAINAVRGAGDTTSVVVGELDSFAGAQNFVTLYGSNPTPWWTDTANKLWYSFHYYFDNDHSGSYADPFSSSNNTAIPTDVTPVMSWSQDNNLNLFCGEYGTPTIAAWQVCITTFLDLCDTYDVHATYWAAGDHYTAVTSIQPGGSSPNFVDSPQMFYVNQHGPNNPDAGNVSTRFVLPVKDMQNNIEVLAWTDYGYLTKQSGMSYAVIPGYSWASGYNLEGAELGNKVYIVNGQQPLVRYDFNELLSFTSLVAPTNLQASNVSGITGTTTFNWLVTALSAVGETLPSTPISLSTLPYEINNTTVRLQWTAPSVPSGATLVGYNVYRQVEGNPTFAWVAQVQPNSTNYEDGGTSTTTFLLTPAPPSQNSTGGPVAKYIIRWQDRLIYAGLQEDPTQIIISGEYPAQERTDIASGGGVLWIEPDSGEDITGLGVYYRTISATQTIVVFKESSVWEVVLDTQTVQGQNVLTPSYRLLTASQGCSSHRSITPVENDVFFINERGVFILRYEPNLYNVVNADELSAKIRPFIQSLSFEDIQGAAGFYADKKYVVSFPISKQAVVFDRERLAFTGPWKFPWSISMWRGYIDANGKQWWLAASGSGPEVYNFSADLQDDFGTPIVTAFKSRREVFDDWTLFKSVTEVFFNFQNITGNVNVNIYLENRAGQVVTAKTFTLTGPSSKGSSGIGIDEIGTFELGTSSGSATSSAQQSQYRALLYQTARTLQVEIDTYGSGDNYQLLNIKSIGLPQSRDNAPSSWTVGNNG